RIGRARTCDGRQCRKPRLLRPHGPLGTGCFVSCLGGPTSGGNAMADVAKSSVVPTPVAARDSAAASAERSADAANRASAVVIGLFVLAVLYTCYFARALLLPVVLAVLFSLLLSPVVRGMRRAGIPEPLGAGLVMAALLGLLAVGSFALADPAAEW